MSELSKKFEVELRGMARRIRADPAHNVRGIVQLASSDDPSASFHIVATKPDDIAFHPGVYPAPDVTVSAPIRTFLNMFAGKFAFFEPDALEQLSIDGDAEKLLPLFGYIGDNSQRLAAFALAEDAWRNRPQPDSIPRVECPSESFVLEALAAYQPLLITGALSRWSWGCKSWTPEYLVRVFGNERVMSAEMYGDSTGTETLASFIERGQGSGTPRSTAGLLPKSMRGAAGHPGYFQPQDYRWPNVFMGTPGVISAVHRDMAHNFATHVFGRKLWRLFSPDQSELLYARKDPSDGPSAQTCEVNVDAPDLERFPLYAQARYIELVVEAGEILLVPSGWFHHVRSLDLCLNIAFSLKWGRGHPGALATETELLDLTAGEEEG